ncbi:Arginase/deacetylase [Basidiobolus meristosporus CBS 931.73]|uniref:histone deacetylase n=1 Tax=Basidiobolus meristosporus CBS 931.73 TaxID=1314790 RepID=A0A1Y1YLV6_9FUNG|nr:Arginase/deacetylase [Basidiobolus meristosporus CBS 931.73]|eukprot:ORX98982.1 Arginase/deacetylase [Basidiobolus meristosporus CBS 931.73]
MTDTFNAKMRPSSRSSRSEGKKQKIDSGPLEYVSRFATGIVYDVRLRFHTPVDSDAGQLENSQRIWKIFKVIQDEGILTKCVRISAREATKEEILLVHSADYHEALTNSADLSLQGLKALSSSYDSVYLNTESAHCARIASGGVIELCRTVYKGIVKNGFAIIRPPGHHAEPEKAMGYCLYNNIAIAARYLQQQHKAKRILIVDWDIHHGNGIQKVFLSDPNVLYISIHRYDESKFYPYDIAAAHHIIGEGEAKGRNINVPWPCSGMGDGDYLHVFNNLLMPVAYEFAPEIVIGDQTGNCLVTPAGYAHMTCMLKSLAGGKLALVLEGGYNVDVTSASALECVKVLTGEDPPALGSLVPSTKCIEITQKVIQAQAKYWNSLESSSLHVSYLNSGLSKERSELLMDEYGLLKLPINGANVPDLFREEVFYRQALHQSHRDDPH